MVTPLSPYRLSKARDAYTNYNVFNAISWNMLVGIIITLLALRLGATSTFIGLMSSAFYIALFLLPVGKLLAKRFSIIGIFSFTWITRSICMILAVAAPFVDYAGHRNTALFLVMLGVLLFHLFRGVGMIANNPVLGLLASGPDRGSFMTQIQIISSSIGMFGSFLLAMILGMDPPIFVFSILLSIGVITGIISGCVIRKVPEPPRPNDGQGMKLRDIFKEAFAQESLRHFLFILFLVVMVSGITRTFAVVYAREVFGHTDGLISLYAVFGGLGHLMAGLIIKFLVDRLGAKPLFFVSIILGLVSLIAVVFYPQAATENVTGTILFMVFLFFMLFFGFLGSEGIAQTYFFGLVQPEKMLDMGILYFFVLGIAGASGTFLAGLLVDLLLTLGLSPFIAFKVLFVIMIILTVIALTRHKKMKPLGSLPLTDALEVIFSFRDLRAISLLGKLNKAEDSHEEKAVLGALHDTPSHLAIDGLLERTRSPKLATRTESIRALEKMNKLSKTAEKALLDDIENSLFTTAYISARILGKHNCVDAIPKLRELSVSEDYMLAGESFLALAKMKDYEFRPSIESIILVAKNPRLRIMGAESLGIFHNQESIPVMLDILREKDLPAYVRDEFILAIAAIIGTQKNFYRILGRYSSDNSLFATLAMDEAESTHEFVKKALNKKKDKSAASDISFFVDNFQNAVSNYSKNSNGAELSRLILELPEHQYKPAKKSTDSSSLEDHSKTGSIIKTVFSEAVIDDDLKIYNSLSLLIVNWAAQELRIWAARGK